jgi:hypothetical protein
MQKVPGGVHVRAVRHRPQLNNHTPSVNPYPGYRLGGRPGVVVGGERREYVCDEGGPEVLQDDGGAGLR